MRAREGRAPKDKECESWKGILQRIGSAGAPKAYSKRREARKEGYPRAGSGRAWERDTPKGKGVYAAQRVTHQGKGKRVCGIREGVWERYGKPNMHGKDTGNPACTGKVWKPSMHRKDTGNPACTEKVWETQHA